MHILVSGVREDGAGVPVVVLSFPFCNSCFQRGIYNLDFEYFKISMHECPEVSSLNDLTLIIF